MVKSYSPEEYAQLKYNAEINGAIAQEIASSKKRSALVPSAIGITILALVVAGSIGFYSFEQITANFPGVGINENSSDPNYGGFEYTAPVDSEGNFVLQTEYDFQLFGTRVISSFVSFVEVLSVATTFAVGAVDTLIPDSSVSPTAFSSWKFETMFPGGLVRFDTDVRPIYRKRNHGDYVVLPPNESECIDFIYNSVHLVQAQWLVDERSSGFPGWSEDELKFFYYWPNRLFNKTIIDIAYEQYIA